MTSFLHCFQYSYCSSNYWYSNIVVFNRNIWKKNNSIWSFQVKSHTQKINHFRLFSYLLHKVYILWDFIILIISLLWLLVPEKQDVQISSISKNRPFSIGHNFCLSIFFRFFSLVPVAINKSFNTPSSFDYI